MTAQEVDALNEYYTEQVGHFLPAFRFWAEERPDVLKRYRLHAHVSGSDSVNAPAMLHSYVIHGYEDGILYEVRNCQNRGLTKDQVLEVLAVAFLHAGPRGSRFIATAAGDYLRHYVDPSVDAEWPTGWSPNPSAVRSGLDFRTPELSADERRQLEEWYLRTLGEVPSHVTFLSEHRPQVLKAYRARFEFALQGALPQQMLPYLMLQYNVSRACQEGIREAALLARALGMGSTQAINATIWGMGFGGGFEGAQLAVEVIEPMLDDWDEHPGAGE